MFRKPRWLLRLALLAAAGAAIVSTPLPSLAGTLQVKDNQSLLSTADVAALRSEAEPLSFDVRVVTTEEHADKSGLDRYVREQLTAPNMVVVGLDKAHRHTAVHFGTGTRVPPAAFKSIEQAGNASFRDGNWRGGIAAILSHTRAAAQPGATQHAQTAAPVRAGGGVSTAAWGLVVVLVVAGLIVFVGVTLARRARNGLLGGEANANANALPPGAGYAPPAGGPAGPGPGAYPPGAYPPGGYPPGGYPPGAYPPGGVQPPGFGAGGGMGRNIAAAGIGGLVGYQLGKMADNHGAPAAAPEQAAAIGNYGEHGNDATGVDAGGSAGSWDEGGSNAGSDWDTGGGGGDDFGGGDGGGDW